MLGDALPQAEHGDDVALVTFRFPDFEQDDVICEFAWAGEDNDGNHDDARIVVAYIGGTLELSREQVIDLATDPARRRKDPRVAHMEAVARINSIEERANDNLRFNAVANGEVRVPPSMKHPDRR